jgi:predicted O-methyltransferase YrrM
MQSEVPKSKWYLFKRSIFRWVKTLHRPPQFGRSFGEDFRKAIGETPPVSDIVDHLSTLYLAVLKVNAKLVVELGTRGGESTRSLLAGVQETSGRMLSVDIDDCESRVKLGDQNKNWTFHQGDDVLFGKSLFGPWCRDRNLSPEIDVLFIDTSHLYDHTKQEIETWSGFVRRGGLMIFHDTNMERGVYRRQDNSYGLGWDNQRGVIRAVQEFVGVSWDEHDWFVDRTPEWIIQHFPNCSGLTLLLRR